MFRFTQTVGKGEMAYCAQYGDLNSGRIGSGTLEYDVPLADGKFRSGVLRAENLSSEASYQGAPTLHAENAGRPGILEIRMPTSYVYLGGELLFDAAIDEGSRLQVFLSDNNGLDRKEVATVVKPGPQKIDLTRFVLRRYDYRLRFVFINKGTGLNSLKINHAIQCSQRALPTLVQGDNTITFWTGRPEGTITIEGTSDENMKAKGKNVTLFDYHPTLNNVAPQSFRVKGKPAEVTFAIATPGDMTRLRFGGHFRARDKKDQWDAQVSFDGGKTFKTVATYVGPTQGKCQFTTVADVPAGTREARVRWSGVERNTCCLFSARIDADYRQPHGGFRPVKITYVWEEGGIEKRDVHVAAKPEETYTIRCESKPEMKSIVLELAE